MAELTTGALTYRVVRTGKVFVGIAVAAVVLGVSMWWLNTQWAGKHVTKCGFDSQGLPYPVVRDNTIGGAKRDLLPVQFNYDNRWHEARTRGSVLSHVSLPTLLGTRSVEGRRCYAGLGPSRDRTGRRRSIASLGALGTTITTADCLIRRSSRLLN